MGAKASGSVWIDAPAEKVFQLVGDLTRHGEWANAPLQVTGPAPAQVGAEFQSQSKFLGKPVSATLRVTSLEPPRAIAFDAPHPDGTYRHWFTLTPERGGTTVARTVELPDSGAVKSAAMKVIIPLAVKPDVMKSLKKLKTLAES